ncbi:uncharacterized protein FSUBG_8048 [Fusarium subglutinans]|uniref:F-box domain-containing protein n=1 Tax=Gibberella subglutinans TaxID=42677 RepID=A0A8H5UXD4_GIBSU|nr:uncharacterized protein FSUBG_8048 [Fusarium subglutinans]KAF5601683.1 hypothetical protein FSUBG_8048 [Fusarium subglutinans]
MKTLSDDEVILKLTCDNELDRCTVIDDIIPAKPSKIHPERPVSCFGLLGSLPAELLLITVDPLDFQSLSRLSRTCLRAKRVVENFVPYQQVIQHAPKVPTALIKTNLAGHYPPSVVYRTLRTDRCVSCTDFGAFLYLPTCERVCFECLNQNRGLWMITIPMAKKYFGLTYQQVQTLPIMRIIPGRYCLRTRDKTHQNPFRLVSVKAVKSLAIQVHGSVENLAAFLPYLGTRAEYTIAQYNFYNKLKRFHEAPVEAPGCDMSKLPQLPLDASDSFAGVSSLRAPYITDTGADWGQLCKGCKITHRDFRYHALPGTVHARLCSPKVLNLAWGGQIDEIALAEWDVGSREPLLWRTEDPQAVEQY